MKYNDGFDISLFHRGICYNAFEYMGAHRKGGKIYFRVWAPHAKKINLVGDFNGWSDSHPMAKVGERGIWECNAEYASVKNNPLYKYKITYNDSVVYKADPYGRQMECPPATATIYQDADSPYNWTDSHWQLCKKDVSNKSLANIPLNIYELHLGSFMRRQNGSYMSYRELAPTLASYIKKMGYTHVELMPISEYPHEGSLGYGSCGYYAPSSRFGSPDDLRYLINTLHNAGVGVILDWNIASLPKDEHGLYKFDGTSLYDISSHDNEESTFDLSKNEVRSFLLSNVYYFIRDFHIDGIKINSLSSLLFLDNEKEASKWTPNRHGGNISFEAVAFLKLLNKTMKQIYPDVIMIADDPKEYKNVTGTDNGGLGFDFVWNSKIASDAMHAIASNSEASARSFRNLFDKDLSSNEIFSLPHNEFMQESASLLSRMPGEYNEKFAAHRAFMTYMIATPCKKLSFMSCEFGQFANWCYEQPIEWFMLDYEMHDKLHRFNADLNCIYLSNELFFSSTASSALSKKDYEASHKKVVVYKKTDSQNNELLFVISFANTSCNLTINICESQYDMLLSTESSKYGGSKTYNNTFYAHNNILRIPLAPYECIILKKVSIPTK